MVPRRGREMEGLGGRGMGTHTEKLDPHSVGCLGLGGLVWLVIDPGAGPQISGSGSE